MRKFKETKVGTVRMEDVFFAPRIQTNHENTLPANISRCRETGRIDSFKLRWKPGMEKKPHPFWDSDFAKVIEGMALSQLLFPDPEREKQLNEFVDLILSAQQPDGYLNSYFTQVEPENRWKHISIKHELYCAGHLMEAAVAHFQATGKRNFLEAMCRYADYIATIFGPAEGQLHGYPGHEEIELALCKLAEASGKEKYRNLASYFVEERGKEPNFFKEEERRNQVSMIFEPAYFQAHKPVREQEGATGHAVRALYLYSGMADVAAATGDDTLLKACKRLWDSVTSRNMYITGGIGSSANGERFTHDYDLPNDSAYAESCAAIALTLFAERMANITGESQYADIMERGLYNGTLSGLSLDGTKFFYANPQEVHELQSTGKGEHTLPERQEWFGCSCCPTNYCRILPQIASFAYAVSEDELRIHIPAQASGKIQRNGKSFAFRLTGNYPYEGKVHFEIIDGEGEYTVSFRIPDWCKKYDPVKINGIECACTPVHGYLSIRRTWKAGDSIDLNFEMRIRRMRGNPRLVNDAGKFVFQYGPLLYALEGIDNGQDLTRLVIPEGTVCSLVPAPQGFPEGTMAITGKALRERNPRNNQLFSDEPIMTEETTFTAIPYALWQNRGKTTMQLWLRS